MPAGNGPPGARLAWQECDLGSFPASPPWLNRCAEGRGPADPARWHRHRAATATGQPQSQTLWPWSLRCPQTCRGQIGLTQRPPCGQQPSPPPTGRRPRGQPARRGQLTTWPRQANRRPWTSGTVARACRYCAELSVGLVPVARCRTRDYSRPVAFVPANTAVAPVLPRLSRQGAQVPMTSKRWSLLRKPLAVAMSSR